MNKILTVSVAAYNVEKYLRQCLDSFVDPVVIDGVEVIIVNDGSTDSTLDIAEQYAKQFPEIFVVVNKQNGGWGSTLNAAIEIASGKYFKQLDGDDYYCNDNLSSFINYLADSDSDLVISPYVEFDHDSGNIIRVIEESQSIARKVPLSLSDIETELVLAMHSVTVKTELLKKNHISITEHCFYTDTEFLIKAVDVSDTISLFDQQIYWYRLGNAGQSVSLEGYLKHYQDLILIAGNMMSYERDAERKLRQVSHVWIYKHLRNTYRVLWSASDDKLYRTELIRFDQYVCNHFPEYSSAAPRAAKLWRKMHYHMHFPCMIASKMRNK